MKYVPGSRGGLDVLVIVSDSFPVGPSAKKSARISPSPKSTSEPRRTYRSTSAFGVVVFNRTVKLVAPTGTWIRNPDVPE